MESWENFGSFSVTSELTGLIKPSRGCTSGHFNLWRNFAGDAHLEGYWNSFVGWFLFIIFLCLTEKVICTFNSTDWQKIPARKGSGHHSRGFGHTEREPFAEHGGWVEKCTKWTTYSYFWVSMTTSAALIDTETHLLAFFFLRSRIIWSVFLYYFLLKDLLFSRWSHLEKDGCTRTPPSDLSPPLY